MNMKRLIATLLFALVGPVLAQVSTAPPLLNYKGTTLPSTCQVGRLFFDTDATAGSNVYGCTSANTWTLQSGGGGSVAIGDVTGLGTNVATALGVAVGSDGAFVTRGGNAGTPSALVGTNITGIPPAGVTGTAAILGANSFTDTQTATKSIAATSTDGVVIQNTTAAAAGAQQWSPRLRLTGQGWKTDATAASQTVSWVAETVPAQGTANPSANLVFSSSINGGAPVLKFAVNSGSQISYGIQFDDTGGYVGFAKYGYTFSTDYAIKANGTYTVVNAPTAVVIANSNTNLVGFAPTLVTIKSGVPFGWGADPLAVGDLLLTRAAAATLQQGAADVAGAPVAQFTRVQSASGVSNTAGADWTLQASAGTGSAAGGAFIVQVAPASGSASTKNAYTNALKISTTALTLSTVVAPASSGTRYLCIDTGGVVTSSASACSGT